VQHGIDGRREQSQVPEPGSAAVVKETAYPLHLSWREPISFAYHKALIPGLVLRCDLLVALHQFAFL
jgi:hypothetical protein